MQTLQTLQRSLPSPMAISFQLSAFSHA